jgi:tetratricopeptide (TPR) repeat protein
MQLALGFSLALLLVISSFGWFSYREWKRAEAAAADALAAAKKSEDVLAFIRGTFTSVRAGTFAERQAVLQTLDRGAALAQPEFANQPELLAAVQYSIGFCYSKLGQWDQASLYLKSALQIQQRLLGDRHLDTLTTERELASVDLSQDKRPEAKALCHRMLVSARAALANSKSDLRFRQFRALELWACRKLAQTFLEEGEYKQAAPLVDALSSALQTSELKDEEDAGIAWDIVGDLALAQGRPQEALKAYDKALAIFPSSWIIQKAWSDGMRGSAFLALGDHARAEPLLTNTLPVLEGRFGERHFRVQRAYGDLVRFYSETGRQEEAAKYRKKLTDQKFGVRQEADQ